MRFTVFDFFSFDRGHNTTRHNYSCYVDGNHNANDNGTDFNDRTDNNNNDKLTWVSSYTGILWHIQLDTWTFEPNVPNIGLQKFKKLQRMSGTGKLCDKNKFLEWSRISKSVFPAQRYYRSTFSIVKLEKPANNPNTGIQLRHWKEIEIYIFDAVITLSIPSIFCSSSRTCTC